ncbi:putative T7SS-secreted protein [Cellulomonas alba]|nr:hypothetical protein [Cellulomonas alba]
MLTIDDPSQLSSAAEDLRRQASSYTDVGTLLRALELGTWTGHAAEIYRERITHEPDRWFDAAQTLLDVATTLDVHADTVRWARARLDDARDLQRRAVTTASPDLGAVLDAEAHAIVRRTTEALDDSTWSVVCHLDRAAALAPSVETWHAPWWDHAWRAVANAGVDAVNALASGGSAIAHHPADALGLVGGVALADVGASAFLGSLAADATGVGAVVGVPVGLASAAAIAAGSTLAVASASDLIMHAESDDTRTPLHELPEGERLSSTNAKGQVREGVADPAPPPGATVGWIKFEAYNASGWVWQERAEFLLGSDAAQFRLMGPTPRYRFGYARYTNSSGQPLDAYGKPTTREATHFEIDDNGAYGAPRGWN